jgi:hypothetical protein
VRVSPPDPDHGDNPLVGRALLVVAVVVIVLVLMLLQGTFKDLVN